LLLLVASAIVVTTLASQPALAASSQDCVTAHVDTPFRLPDGLLYPAGPLTLCDNRTFSPVNDLHKILVGGSSVGFFVSRKRSAEVLSIDSPELVFNRDADGNLELIGYTMRTSGGSVAYRLKSEGVTSWQASIRPRSGGGESAPVAAIVASTGTR
jgi:hypothetical protein